MKFSFVFFLAIAFFIGCAQGHTSEDNTTSSASDSHMENGRLQIMTSVFPQYDFIRQIAGDRVDLSMMISPGGEPHAFEPSPRDIIALNNADLIVYVGGHGEAWVDLILNSLEQPGLRRIALMNLVDVVYTDIVEGMEHDHDHGHSHGHGHGDGHHHDDHDDHHHDDHSHNNDDHHHDDHSHDNDDHHHDDHSHDHDDHHHDDHSHDHHDHHHEEYDEHVWTSPRNAITIVRALTEILAELDPDNTDFFRGNSAAFIAELEALDRAFAEVVANSSRNTVVFGDRFPFRYLMDAYGINYFAAFPGCSAETQASPGTIAFLIDKVNAENIPVVFYTEFSARTIANVIVEATGAQPMQLHSAHNVSVADFNSGRTYIEIMQFNLEHLREALN